MRLANARVALDGRTAEQCDLTISDGRVSFSNHPEASEQVVDLSDCLILPGLINAHDHLEFNLFPRLGRSLYPNARSWASDIYQPDASPVKEHLALSKRARMIWGGLKTLLSGVTTVAHHNPFEETIFNESFPVNVVKCFGWAHSLDFSPDLVKRFEGTPKAWPFILHASEGVDRHAQAEITQLDKLGILSDRTVLVHAIGMDQPDLLRLREARTALVWCPTSNVSTYGRTLPEAVLRSGLNIALGTDSALTAPVDLLDEIALVRSAHRVAADDAFEMVTSRSARVLRLTRGEGTIRESGAADLLIVNDRGQSPAEALLDLQPQMVIVRGKARLLSARFACCAALSEKRAWHAITVEGRDKAYTDVPLPALHAETIQALGSDYRLAGKRVSL